MRGVGKWTDVELSRWIAEKLADTRYPGASDIGYSWNPDWNNGSGRMEPRDMVHDATMTVMLLEKLLPLNEFGSTVTLRRYTGSRVNISVAVEVHSIGTSSEGKLGRAVAEAFAIANGAAE